MRRLATAAAVSLLALVTVPGARAAIPIPITGPPTPPGMEAWDDAAEQVMQRQGIPGAVLAVAYQGRLVLEHGYGYADTNTKQPVEPDAAFRLASVTKSITGTAVDRLINAHKLSSNTHPFQTVLASLRGPHGRKPVDRRVRDITIAELLAHKAGWDINKIGFDPTSTEQPVEKGLGIHTTPTCEQVITYMLGRRLNYKPGTRYSYSNLGYCVLGDVVAHIMRTSYGKAIKKLVLDPIGMSHTHPSQTQLTARLPGEVHYYGQGTDSGSQDPYVLPEIGTFGAAGEVSTAIDLQRFIIVTSGEVPGSKPWAQPGTPGDGIYGVQPPFFRGISWEFDGSEPGVTTSLGIDGRVSYVFLGNSRRPQLEPDNSPLHKVAETQSSWPSGNLLDPPAS